MGSLADAITAATLSVTKRWAKQRKQEERHAQARARRMDAMTRYRGETIREVAFEVMESAYLAASANGSLPAHARQIMYAARPAIVERTQRQLNDVYFTQQLLPEYLRDHEEETADWDVVFDARGHFEEPHTNKIVPIGTIDVRKYLEDCEDDDSHASLELPDFNFPETELYSAFDPGDRYGAILFIEKEGFLPLLKRVNLAERYDVAVMSTKGMSSTAGRELAEALSGRRGLPLLVLHDFDKAGFSILATLRRDTQRFQFSDVPNVIDLGIRLADVKKWNLPSESIQHRGEWKWNVLQNGATPAEVNFLEDKRVELNAFTSDAFIEWLEGKLAKHGVKKIVPDDAVLEAAYRRAVQRAVIARELEEIGQAATKQAESARLPKGLRRDIYKSLRSDPTRPWDFVVASIAGANCGDGDGDE